MQDEMDVIDFSFTYQPPINETFLESTESLGSLGRTGETGGTGGGTGGIDRIEIPQIILDRATALKYRLSNFYKNLLSETIDREKR